ncbi:hypothetical protein E4U23_004848 [Claviceps purpurea]|nr:hypothetical protein E4U37_000146 [Claviceps purpurea]KAG6165274.1 hypothetical protein E4U51_004479 [Claviceps purpurea]KAG6246145.1 hypothetical protein E4U23_004848 [Claviceps purpurea]
MAITGFCVNSYSTLDFLRNTEQPDPQGPGPNMRGALTMDGVARWQNSTHGSADAYKTCGSNFSSFGHVESGQGSSPESVVPEK